MEIWHWWLISGVISFFSMAAAQPAQTWAEAKTVWGFATLLLAIIIWPIAIYAIAKEIK